MKNKKFTSIKLKLVVLLSASVGIALLLSSIVIFSFTFLSTKDAALKNLSQLTTVIGANLSASLEFDDKDAANMILKSLKKDEKIKGAYIFKNIELFTSYIKKGESKNLISETILYVYGKNDKKKFIKYIDYNDIVTSYPIYSGEDFLGTFTIVANTSDIKNTLISQLIMLFIVAFVILILIIIIALRVQKIFTNPIYKLKSAMDSFSKNMSYDSKLSRIDTNDEFNSLYDGFNSMLSTIAIQTKELHELHEKTDISLLYASIVQKTLLPKDSSFASNLSEHFTIYKPKEKVGGDIYFHHKINEEESLIMLFECSGKGMHGAYVTMLVKQIQSIVIPLLLAKDEELSPASILNTINRSMINILSLEDKDLASSISYNGAIVYFNKKQAKLSYCGISIPMYYLDEDSNVIKLDAGTSSQLVNHEVQTYKDMSIYLLTDAYSKQLSINTLDIIDELQEIKFSKQKDVLSKKLDTSIQKNDITIIGLKV